MGKKLIMMSILKFLGIAAAAQSMKTAEAYFKSGNFNQAKSECTHIIEKQPQNLKAFIYLGYILLMENKLDEAESWLLKANKIKPNFATINNFLAEIYYRRNDFDKAAACFKVIGREGMALKLAHFKSQRPYQIDKLFDEAHIKFIVTSPLPIVKVKINGQYEGNFMLDTGGGELILDEVFGRETSAETFGKPEISHFGGGKKANISHGKISSIQLDDLTVNNIPIQLLALRHIELAGIKIDGIIGTVFLSQFLSTIDYKNGYLVLRNKHTHFLNQLSAKAINASLIPFLMAGDHYMVAKGYINNSDTMLFFIDTGLGNTAFTCPRSTVKKMKLPLQKNKKSTAQGGGGKYNIYPFDIEKLCLVNVCVSNLHGLYGPFPKTIEHSFGFKIDGLLSHEFFLNKTLTIDFESMKYLISE